MYEDLLTLLIQQNGRLATAESCTGGLVAAAITDIAGISQVYMGSIVAYDNSVKKQLLKVPANILESVGAVSEECAGFMAAGAAGALNCNYAVSTTGIAGPGGAVPGKPAGTVCIGYFIDGKIYTETKYFSGNRQEVRQQTVKRALTQLIKLLQEK